MSAGAFNAYTCLGCRGTIVTVDRAEGVTPFMLACRATPGCGGFSQSHFYRLPADHPPATFEWYAPSSGQRSRLSPEMRAHVDNGGLLIRAIGTSGGEVNVQ